MPEARLQRQREFGYYVLLSQLGKGGMGEVWKAMDKRLGRVVALKFISNVREGSTAANELFREARAASVLNHPNIVTVLDIGESDQGSYLAMEFVDGESLRARLAQGSLSLDQGMRIFRQVAEGLSVAHQRGIIHRDLKPENIMVRVDGYVKLVDFGLAKVLPWTSMSPADSEAPTIESSSAGQTETGSLVGTFRYMSPEQARGLQLTASSDVFSLGIVMHEALTGEHPFNAPTMMDTMQAILSREPESVRTKCPDVPDEISSAILRAMHKDPSQRFASGLEMLKGLDQASQRGALAHAQRVRHQPKWMKVVGGILISFVLVGVALKVPTGNRSDVTAIRLQNIQSVAVVTFQAPAGDEQAQILAQALPADITMALGKSGLRVAASSKAIAGGENEDPQTIGTRLGVDSVLQGTVRSYGSRIRVRLELVSTTTGFQLWNETLTIEPGDLLTNEEKIASEVEQKLRTAVAGGR